MGSMAAVYFFLVLRWLAMLFGAFALDDDDEDIPNNWRDHSNVFFMCKAAVYIFIDLTFAPRKTVRLVYSIGVQVIMICENVLIIIMLSPLMMGESVDGFSLFGVTTYSHFIIVGLAYACLRVSLWCTCCNANV